MSKRRAAFTVALLITVSAGIAVVILHWGSSAGKPAHLGQVADTQVATSTGAVGRTTSPSPQATPVSGVFPLQSYYLESRVSFPGEALLAPKVIIKGWWQARDKTRWEVSCGGSALCGQAKPRILLVVGGDEWYYEPETNSYESFHDIRTGNDRPYPLLSNYQPGPISPDFFPERFDAAIPKERETVIGISVTSYAGSLLIDEEHQFLLREEGTDAGGTRFVVEVTRADYNPTLEASVFQFEPPKGAREATPRPTAPSGTPGMVQVTAAKFLDPSYLPSGYSFRSNSVNFSSSLGADCSSQSKFYASPNSKDQLIIVEQTGSRRKCPSNKPIAVGTPTALGDYQGFFDGTKRFVTRGIGDVIVTVYSSELAFDELLKIAESIDGT